MGITSDDGVKQKLLDSLAEEPPMVISTAYAYAKNYVMYGEDITKAWTTAVQQASVIQEVRQKAWVEAYDSFKKDYEKCLKSDIEAILEELDLEVDELASHFADGRIVYRYQLHNLIQDKINSLKENTDDKI